MSTSPWHQSSFSSSTLEVFLLGCVDFESSSRLLERLRDEIQSRGDSHGILVVCEHPPTITIGREGSFTDVLVDREELISRRIDVRWTSRGGGAILHAPGQVVIYPILPLDRLRRNVIEFRDCMEKSLILAARDLDVPAESGGLVPGAIGRCGQFAFIGAGVRSWVSHGGVFVNVSVPHDALRVVRWKQDAGAATSLSALRLKPTAMPTVRECLVRHLAEVLGYGDYQLYTGHPLLKRTRQKIYVFN